MENKPDNIGKLFQEKFEDYSVEGSSEEWLALDMKLDKVNFFKFNISQFNVYYAGLIGLCFSLSSAVFVDHFFLSKETTNKVAQEATIPAQEDIEQVSTTKEYTISKPLAKTAPSDKEKIKHPPLASTHSEEKNTTVVETPLIEKEIEQQKTGDNKKTPEHTTEKVQNKKVVYVTRQDTLIVYDTLTVKKRKAKHD